MAKIRDDIVGVVSVGGLNLKPGDDVPEGVSVGDHVLAPKADPVPVESSEDEKPRRRSRKSEGE